MRCNSAPVPIKATVIRSEGKQNQEKPEVGITYKVTVAEEPHKTPPLIQVEWRTMKPPKSECVVLVTTEVEGQIHFDALPE